MPATLDAFIDIVSGRDTTGVLCVRVRGDEPMWKGGIPYLLDADGDPAVEPATSRIQLLEESEYIYEIKGIEGPVRLQPTEMFDRNDDTGHSGRLRPGRHVGTVATVVLDADGECIGKADFEVRSRKLDYLTDFQWMLNRIASVATDLLLAHFAPAAVSLKADGEASTTGIYSRFALLRSLLENEELESAIQLVLHHPHSEYRSVSEYVNPSRGLRSGRHLSRALTGPGPRQEIRSGVAPRGLSTLPERVEQVRHIEVVDTVPNRFVKYALERWRGIAADVIERLRNLDDSASLRGVAEAVDLTNRLDLLLDAPMFNDVGKLDQFPAGNQVLQRREGYRDVFRAFFEVEAAAAIEWGDTDDVFPAGSKDVATLYEYWVYLELARIIRDMPAFAMDSSTLIESSPSGLTLNLRQGKQSVVRGNGVENGRRIDIELFYNRMFAPSTSETGAWTCRVRPDCSLHISSSDPLGNYDDVWLHFDAKYRVRDVYEAFGQDVDDDDPIVAGSYALTDDLLKMHTYLDAIKRTAGSYVLYPGQVPDPDKSRFERYHEIVPGIGAFALRPTAAGEASVDTESVLQDFIRDVIDHVSRRGTGLERADYWVQETYARPTGSVPPTTLLTEPPVDTLVLVGFVKSPEHWTWIEQTGLYNLRADDRRGSVDLSSRLLDASFLLLHDRVGSIPRLVSLSDAIYIRTAEELSQMGYPEPRGQRYVCVHVTGPIDGAIVPDVTNDRIGEVKESAQHGGLFGAPMIATWEQIFGEGVR